MQKFVIVINNVLSIIIKEKENFQITLTTEYNDSVTLNL